MRVSHQNDDDEGTTGFWRRVGDAAGDGISSRLERLKELLMARYRISDEEAERRLRKAGLDPRDGAPDSRAEPPRRPWRPQPEDESVVRSGRRGPRGESGNRS